MDVYLGELCRLSSMLRPLTSMLGISLVAQRPSVFTSALMPLLSGLLSQKSESLKQSFQGRLSSYSNMKR